MDLFKAGVISLTPLAFCGIKTWAYEHRCRVTVQRQGVTRTRPALKVGWSAQFELLVNTPEYIDQHVLYDAIAQAGRLIGIADFRPTYGRFIITQFDLIED